MSNPLTKTDNSYMAIKVAIRKNEIGDLAKAHVLDAYSGHGDIWRKIKRELPGTVITVDEIEIKKRKGIYLRGDNLKYLSGMELSQYDVIDLDAYGIPYKQLEIIFKYARTRHGEKKAIIFFTFIQTIFGMLPHGMLSNLGYTKAMILKIPTLFSQNGFDKFKQYLGNRGVRQIKYISKGNKHYGSFEIRL